MLDRAAVTALLREASRRGSLRARELVEHCIADRDPKRRIPVSGAIGRGAHAMRKIVHAPGSCFIAEQPPVRVK